MQKASYYNVPKDDSYKEVKSDNSKKQNSNYSLVNEITDFAGSVLLSVGAILIGASTITGIILGVRVFVAWPFIDIPIAIGVISAMWGTGTILCLAGESLLEQNKQARLASR